MKVITLHPSDLDSACHELAASLQSFRPAIVVGILTGGGEVGRRVASCLTDTSYYEISLQRPSTHTKHRLAWLLRRLPLWIADTLRRYESRRVARSAPASRHAALPAALAAALGSMPAPRVLIVDDAVDSGMTLKAVIQAVKSAAPDADVRSAVLTVTTPHPAVEPEYALWRREVLLRFPWSLDYKKI